VKLMRKRQKWPWLCGPHLSDASPTSGTGWEIDCARLHRCRSTTDHARSPLRRSPLLPFAGGVPPARRSGRSLLFPLAAVGAICWGAAHPPCTRWSPAA
jgi:hypothetical protein